MDAVTTTSRSVPGSADPVKAVSVISTETVRIRPEQLYGTPQPLYWWLLASRKRTPPRLINVYVIGHARPRSHRGSMSLLVRCTGRPSPLLAGDITYRTEIPGRAAFPAWATGGGSRRARARSSRSPSSSRVRWCCPPRSDSRSAAAGQLTPGIAMATFDDTSMTASDAGLLTDGPRSSDVLLLGAAGSSGRLIAAELAARGLSVRLTGRHRGPLEDLAQGLAVHGSTMDVRTVDVSDAASLADAIAGVGVVVSTIGPFARLAGPVVDACLAARSPYVDIANEWSAVRDLLDRDKQARALEVALVTGAGFGPAATETLVLRLVGLPGMVPARVRVAAAAQVTRHGEGVRQTIEESLSQGAITYRDGRVVREPLGSGATILTFGGAPRRMLPGPVGDLEAARRASGAPDVVAYIADPAAPISLPDSVAWAEIVASDGTTAVAELVAGDGLRAMAAIAAETTARVLAGAAPGAWTAGRLLGPALVTRATGARVTVNGQPA